MINFLLKACYRYYGDTLNTEDTKNMAALTSNESHRGNIINSRKFKAVVTEMEALLGEFKCLMDGCLDMTSPMAANDQVQTSNNDNKQDENGENNSSDTSSAVHKSLGDSVSLSPELARAYEKPLDTRWKIKDQTSINALYQQFFNVNTEDQERR